MNFYRALRPLFFRLNPELAHNLTIKLLSLTPWLLPKLPSTGPERQLMGLNFKNNLGLAAGLDKDGHALSAWQRLGFGHIELGTVTPLAQPGNGKPRLFRLPEHRAIINRMGFNNEGVGPLVGRLRQFQRRGLIVGVNLGKNKQTANEDALSDYLLGLQAAYEVADYLTINVSSPNTVGLRDLQRREELGRLLYGLKEGQQEQQNLSGKYTPLVLKIAPDNSDEELMAIIEGLREYQLDGIICTNTTLDRAEVITHKYGKEPGGLSGEPLRARATAVVRKVRRALPTICIFAAGGVMARADFEEKLEAGADLVQIYSGLIYEGPELIRDCLKSAKTLGAQP